MNATRVYRLFRRCLGLDRPPIMSRREIERAYRELEAAAIKQVRALERPGMTLAERATVAPLLNQMLGMTIAVGAILQANSQYRLVFKDAIQFARRINAAAAYPSN